MPTRNAVLIGASLLVASLSHASSIFTIHSTGAGANNPAGIADLNWTINGSTAFVTDNSGFPFPNWSAADNLPSYGWISPQASYTGGETDAPGSYVFQTTFDLTGYDPTTAVLQFLFAVDNSVASVTLNGNDMGISGGTFGLSSTQTINSGFVSGINTLIFNVTNDPGSSGNPVGLLVDITSATASAENTPEPPEPLLVGAGLTALGFLVRQRKLSP